MMVDCIFRTLIPREKVEAVIKGRERLVRYLQSLRSLAKIIEVSLSPFSSTFDKSILAAVQGIERSGYDLSRLVGEVGADLAEFGDVEILKCARAHRSAYAYARMVVEYQLSCAIDGCYARALDDVRQLIVGKLDALEDILSVLAGVGDYPSRGVGLKKALIKKEKANEGSNT